MRFLIPILLLSHFSLAQADSISSFDCEPYYLEYCRKKAEKAGNEHSISPGYMIPHGREKDSARTSIPGCIDDLNAFCRGVEMALEEDELFIRSVGQSNHCPACVYHAYKKWGVYLTFTGDVIEDPAIFDENAGYNSVMLERIRAKLGDDYEKLGEEDESWAEVSRDEAFKMLGCFKRESASDSTTFIQLDTVALAKTQFGHLQGAYIWESHTKKKYSYEDMVAGITVTHPSYLSLWKYYHEPICIPDWLNFIPMTSAPSGN